jgi:DNA repair exonuclease SbcCD nuclease subunit
MEFEVHVILMGGDLFHSEQTASFEIIHIAQDFVKECHRRGIEVKFLQGNHDEICHSGENSYRSAMGVFMNSQYVVDMNSQFNDKEVKGCNFDEDNYDGYPVIVKHCLCMPKEKIPFGVECETPESLLDKYTDAKFLCLGDYHRNFHFEKDGRHVINPGCLTKQAADFENYQTGCYYFCTESEKVVWCPIDIEQKFNHNGQEKKAQDENIEKFAESISKQDVTLDYVSSLKNEAEKHEDCIKEKINSWIEQSGN